jgi:hypothetical protein
MDGILFAEYAYSLIVSRHFLTRISGFGPGLKTKEQSYSFPRMLLGCFVVQIRFLTPGRKGAKKAPSGAVVRRGGRPREPL